jgi:hypothetical protein
MSIQEPPREGPVSSPWPSIHRGRGVRFASAGIVRMTGMAFSWAGATIAFASLVRKPKIFAFEA